MAAGSALRLQDHRWFSKNCNKREGVVEELVVQVE